jgi:hypothetical protein
MNHTHYCKHRPLRLSLIALVAAVTWGSVGTAYADHWRRYDNVRISGSPATTVTAGQAYSFTPAATDSYGRTLAFAITNKPAWATFSTSSGRLSGTPSAASVGTCSNIVIAVSDGVKSATLPAFAVQVLTNQAISSPPPPTISGTPSTSDVAGSAYSFQPTASGPSGMTLSFSVQNKPAWANFSIATGLLSGTPASTQAGTYGNIIVSVSDGQASSALPMFSITVTAPATTTGTARVSVTPPAQNSDGTPLTNLAGMRIYYGTSPTSLSQQIQLASTTPATYTVSNLASGTWYFGATAYTTAGTESALSPVVTLTLQ